MGYVKIDQQRLANQLFADLIESRLRWRVAAITFFIDGTVQWLAQFL